MSRVEKVEELVARGERLGLRFAFDSGLMTVRRTATAEPDRQQFVFEELGKYLPELHTLLESRAIYARTNQLMGQPVWSPEFGEGTVASADSGLLLGVAFQMEGSRHAQTLKVSADSVVILPATEVSAASARVEEQPKAAKPARGFFGQLLGRRGEN